LKKKGSQEQFQQLAEKRKSKGGAKKMGQHLHRHIPRGKKRMFKKNLFTWPGGGRRAGLKGGDHVKPIPSAYLLGVEKGGR